MTTRIDDKNGRMTTRGPAAPPRHPLVVKLMIERMTRGWSQKFVAKEIRIDPNTLSRFERGRAIPKLDVLSLWCDLFDMDIDGVRRRQP
jgi:DNA-binding XRE family transcriptional regulator